MPRDGGLFEGPVFDGDPTPRLADRKPESTLSINDGERPVLVRFGGPLSWAASFFALTFDSSAFSHSNVQFFDVLVQYVHGRGGLVSVAMFSFAEHSLDSSTKGRVKGDAPDG
jgi:hypothetical protein